METKYSYKGYSVQVLAQSNETVFLIEVGDSFVAVKKKHLTRSGNQKLKLATLNGKRLK